MTPRHTPEKSPPSTPPPTPTRGRRFGGDLLTSLFEDAMDPGYIDAAQRGKKSNTMGLVGRVLALVVIGFLFAVAYLKVVTDAPAAVTTHQELVADVHRDRDSADRLETRTKELREQVAKLRDQALVDAGGDAAHLHNLEAQTGLGQVSGAAISVTVGDAHEVTDPVTGLVKTDSSGKIYDRDLQKVVNALWSVGAEAITVDNQRISAVSTIRAAGGAILVDFRPVSSPYRIVAIGPDNLERRFKATPDARQFNSYKSQYGIKLDISREGTVTLPAAPDPQLQYATPSVAAPPITGSD